MIVIRRMCAKPKTYLGSPTVTNIKIERFGLRSRQKAIH